MKILPPSMIQMCDLLRENGFAIPEGIHHTSELAEVIASQVVKHG